MAGKSKLGAGSKLVPLGIGAGFAAVLIGGVIYLATRPAVPEIAPPANDQVSMALRQAMDACLANPKQKEQFRRIEADVSAKISGSMKAGSTVAAKDVEVIVDRSWPPELQAKEYAVMRECIRDRFLLFYAPSASAATMAPASKAFPALKVGLSRRYVEEKFFGPPSYEEVHSSIYEPNSESISDEMTERAQAGRDEGDETKFIYATYETPHFNVIVQYDPSSQINGLRLERTETPDPNCIETNIRAIWPLSEIYDEPLCFDNVTFGSLFSSTVPSIYYTPSLFHDDPPNCSGFINSGGKAYFNDMSITCYRQRQYMAQADVNFIVRGAREATEDILYLPLDQTDLDGDALFRKIMKEGADHKIQIFEIYRLARP